MALDMHSPPRMTNLIDIDKNALATVTGGIVHHCTAREAQRARDGKPMTSEEFSDCLKEWRDPNKHY